MAGITNAMGKPEILIVDYPAKKKRSRKGNTYVPATSRSATNSNAVDVRLVYNSDTGILDNVKPVRKNKANKAAAEKTNAAVRNITGRWSERISTPVHELVQLREKRRRYVLPPEEERRKYDPTICFHKRRIIDKNGNVTGIKYCYSHKLINSYPLGDVLLACFLADPQGFMDAHPELCADNGNIPEVIAEFRKH